MGSVGTGDGGPAPVGPLSAGEEPVVGPRPETRREGEERLYARAEQKLEKTKARRIRRGPETLIAVLIGLSLTAGAVAVVDLRRLMTPRGTALAWTGAAVFGDCTAYEALSTAAPSGPTDLRKERARCLDLRRSTAPNREEASRIGIDLQTVEQQSRRQATAQMRISRPDEVRVVLLRMQRKGDGWAVLRTGETCAAVGCA